jgi:hypothetical protein
MNYQKNGTGRFVCWSIILASVTSLGTALAWEPEKRRVPVDCAMQVWL